MTAELPATHVTEWDCARRCRVEVNLDETDGRTTVFRLRERAATAHDTAHKKTEKVFTFGDVTVHAMTLEPVAEVLR